MVHKLFHPKIVCQDSQGEGLRQLAVLRSCISIKPQLSDHQSLPRVTILEVEGGEGVSQ